MKNIWPGVFHMHVRVARSSDSLWARRLLLYWHAVQTPKLPDAFAGPTPSLTLTGEDRWMDNCRQWWNLLDAVLQSEPMEKRQAAFAELATELTGDLVGQARLLNNFGVDAHYSRDYEAARGYYVRSREAFARACRNCVWSAPRVSRSTRINGR